MVQEVSGQEEFHRLTGQKGKLVVVSYSVFVFTGASPHVTSSMSSTVIFQIACCVVHRSDEKLEPV